MKPAILFRVDAGVQMGVGHVMRCMALAQALHEKGGRAIFVSAGLSSGLRQRLEKEKMEVIAIECEPGSSQDAEKTVKLAEDLNVFWIVLDGYHFSDDYEKILKNSQAHLFVLDDDRHAAHKNADAILNPNPYANQDLYKDLPSSKCFLIGNSYSLLRKEFLNWSSWQRDITKIGTKILVTMGGSDPDNMTLLIIQALHSLKLPELQVTIVVGANNPHREELEKVVNQNRVVFQLKIDTEDMPNLMAWADLGISGAGTTTWEIAYMQLPNLGIILSKNQQPVAEYLESSGLGINLEWGNELNINRLGDEINSILHDDSKRRKMSQQGRNYIDGQGAQRVLQKLMDLSVNLRPVASEDCKLLWEWANEKEVRTFSFSSEPILWETHLQWFESKIRDPHCKIYIATDFSGDPLGQVRYDIQDKEAVVSVSVSPNHRGKNLGKQVLSLSSKMIRKKFAINRIHAYIKNQNERSIRVFKQAGYRLVGNCNINGQNAEHWVYE